MKVLTEQSNYTNIANAIRSKNGSIDTYKPSEMPTAILNIPSGGGGGVIPKMSQIIYRDNLINISISPILGQIGE